MCLIKPHATLRHSRRVDDKHYGSAVTRAYLEGHITSLGEVNIATLTRFKTLTKNAIQILLCGAVIEHIGWRYGLQFEVHLDGVAIESSQRTTIRGELKTPLAVTLHNLDYLLLG
jgi:hypothetical protein